MAGFATSRRVALTGHPLMNNLREYFTMIAWACPGFFPKPSLFDKDYTQPIEAGRKVDASRKERRKMLQQSTLLRGLLEAVLHRVDGAALQATLPHRLDMLLTLALPPPVKFLYRGLVTQVRVCVLLCACYACFAIVLYRLDMLLTLALPPMGWQALPETSSRRSCNRASVRPPYCCDASMLLARVLPIVPLLQVLVILMAGHFARTRLPLPCSSSRPSASAACLTSRAARPFSSSTPSPFSRRSRPASCRRLRRPTALCRSTARRLLRQARPATCLHPRRQTGRRR
jgi:SNF2-related domain